ncbi:Na(+)/H(+) antiporter subunit B [Pradoshia sp. D12]|uniref:Na(+)/H(+) antiporter subunit B n=1 Tax=Bacillaceae TaxID=186817 RepID=UPI00080AF72D|nr:MULTISPECIES: Na(+)/H(+) antiporter subunit B [Bacillaceae]OCA81125.1 Na(+)/H(+) antiporter subunit B [Bacillus sp. FJAT-27986]QFK73057.1 Na(+)/H(+) antiporter subunit B [Pradoshia sp. D12]TPF72049.1 Na(+)/H(+) antiporter subunit B [Bacillus sp. D12]
MKPNDILLTAVTKVAVLIILTFSIDLFFSGHHNPGGGFIGGLGIASALVLMYLTLGTEAVNKIIPVDFKTVAAIGVLIAILTGVGSFLFGVPFLSQTYGYVDFPILGKTELATALIFDTGVALAVIGSAVTIILSISEDR